MLASPSTFLASSYELGLTPTNAAARAGAGAGAGAGSAPASSPQVVVVPAATGASGHSAALGVAPSAAALAAAQAAISSALGAAPGQFVYFDSNTGGPVLTSLSHPLTPGLMSPYSWPQGMPGPLVSELFVRCLASRS